MQPTDQSQIVKRPYCLTKFPWMQSFQFEIKCILSQSQNLFTNSRRHKIILLKNSFV